MRRVIVICGLVCLLAAGSGLAQPKYMFSIRSGGIISSACFGMDMGRVVPMVGTDFLYVSGSASSIDEDYSSYTDQGDEIVDRHIYEDKVDGRAFLLVPQVGAKVYLRQTGLRPYLLGSLFFTVPFVDGESTSREEYWHYENGELVGHGVDIDTEKLSEKDKALLKDALGLWGITIAGGGEYFLNERLSIGGEYGIRLFLDTAEQGERSGYGGDIHSEKDKASASIGLTHAAIVLNYHF